MQPLSETHPFLYVFANIIYDATLFHSASPCRLSNRFSYTVVEFSLSSSLSLRSGFPLVTTTAAVWSTPPVPVSLILSARFTSSIRSSKQINCATPLELIGELVILDGNFWHKFTAVFLRFPADCALRLFVVQWREQFLHLE